MTFDMLFMFAGTSALIGLVPGPGVTSIVGYALGSGRRTALASVAGIAVGNAIAMTLSLAGIGAVLAASANAFTLLKWTGAFYLIATGLVALRRAGRVSEVGGWAGSAVAARTAFLGNLAIGTFHPKTIVFFVAFAPQFIVKADAYLPQAALLIVTFCATVGATDTAYALAASKASDLLRRPKARLWSKRVGGGALIISGLATATARNP